MGKVPKQSRLTIAAIAIVAYAMTDEIHEVLGHGLIALATPGVRIVALSTMALSTQGGSRLIAAAGPLVNALTGMLALLACRRSPRFDAWNYCLWLFGTISLLNATGYLAYSGVLDFGDWAVVFSGLQPRWLWRGLMVLVGLAGYFSTVGAAAPILVRHVQEGKLACNDVGSLMLTSYLTGGLLLSAGAALNPLGLKLALLTGVAGSFGAMLGLLLVTPLVERRAALIPAAPVGQHLSIHRGWLIAGGMVAVLFIVLLGPGIRFH